MPEPTLQDLAKRLEVVERELAELKAPPRKKDWRRVAGMFRGSEFMQQMDAEVAARREAERAAARAGNPE